MTDKIMREYPHGLDEEILPEDFETEQDIIEQLQEYVEQAYIEKKSSLFKGLGKSYYALGCYGYALGDSPAEITEPLSRGLQYLYDSFEMGIPQQAYEFIKLLSLAVVLGNTEIAESLSETGRERYTNENVEVEEITFAVAELMCAFVRKDGNAAARIIERYKSAKIEENKIFRFDRLLYFPLFRLLSAAYRRDSSDFTAALEKRKTDFVKYFSRADMKNDPTALIDMPGLAVMAFAAKRGLNVSDESVYLPQQLTRY